MAVQQWDTVWTRYDGLDKPNKVYSSFQKAEQAVLAEIRQKASLKVGGYYGFIDVVHLDGYAAAARFTYVATVDYASEPGFAVIKLERKCTHFLAYAPPKKVKLRIKLNL